MKTDDGILFRSVDHTFAIRGGNSYAVFQRLLPYLDGKRAFSTLLDALPEPSRTPLTQLLTRLRDKRVVDRVDPDDAPDIDEAVAGQFAPQIDFIAHYTAQPRARFLAFRSAAVLLSGRGIAFLSAGRALLRNGLETLRVDCPDDEDLTLLQAAATELRGVNVESTVERHDSTRSHQFDLLLYCAEEPDLATLDRLNRAAVANRVPFLPAYTHAGHNVVGPMVLPGRAGCWCCTLLRWADNASGREACETWSRLALGTTRPQERATTNIAAQILGNGAAMEACKFFTLDDKAESRHRLLLQEVASLASELKSVLPHPDCSVCAEATATTNGMATPAVDNARILDAWKPYLDSRFGLYRGFDDDSLEQLPLRLTRILLNRSAAERLGDSDAAVTAWSLRNTDEARAKALRGAIVLSTIDGFPAALDRASQPLSRLAGAPHLAASALHGWHGSRGEAPASHRYLPVQRLDGAARSWVPAGAVHPLLDRQACFDHHGGGVGCGVTTDQAIDQALLSLCGHLTISGLADGSLLPRVLSPWRGRLGKDVDYLAIAAEQLGLSELRVGLVSPRPGLFAAVECADGSSVGVDDLALGVGFSIAQAVGDLLGWTVARAQLAAHGKPLRLMRRAGVLSGAEIVFVRAAESIDAGDASLMQASSAARRDTPCWWIDITPPDVVLTGSFRVARVLLDGGRTPHESE